ncbi:tuber agglutinin [Tanacetum coccineum]
MGTLTACDEAGIIFVVPQTLMAKRMKKKGNKAVDDVVQAGQWGGGGGKTWIFRTNGGRIFSYIITRNTQCIYSLEFGYTDKSGNKHRTGQYGTLGSINETNTFDNDEDITEIGGTVGPFAGMTVITSLYFRTNKKVYEIGDKNGTNFSLPLTKGKFEGFYGRSGDVIDSFGAVLVA